MFMIRNTSTHSHQCGGHSGVPGGLGARGLRGAAAGLILAALGLMALAPGASAKDYILVLGGGPSLESSEYSIEQNVIYFQQIRDRLGMASPTVKILFASGAGESLDVRQQTRESGTLRLTLAKLMGSRDSDQIAEIDYRHNQICGSDALVPDTGPCRRDDVMRALTSLSRSLQPRDRLLIYMTGHGGKGKPVENGHFFPWESNPVSVRDFTAKLDQFDPKVQVFLVMVQCYSGSFANVIYQGGDPSRGLAKHERAGFFAATDSLPAAGCTPEIKLDAYEDFSTYFWAALAGQDRLGKPAPSADYNRDGRISGSEAFFYSIVETTTIDMPVSTSDSFLRRHAPKASSPSSIDADHEYSKLLKAAAPLERLALENITKRLNLTGEDRIAKAKERMNGPRVLQPGDNPGQLSSKDRTLRRSLSQSLTSRWPFLKSGWHPQTAEAVAKDDPLIWDALKSHPSYEEWVRNRDALDRSRLRLASFEKRERKLERLIRLAETIVLADNLEKSGSDALKKRYQALRRLEDSFLVAQTRS